MAPRKPVQFMLVAATSFHQAPHTEGAAPKHLPVPCGQRSLKGFCSITHTPHITSVFQLKRKGWYKAVRTQADKQCGMQGQPTVLHVTLSGPGTEAQPAPEQLWTVKHIQQCQSCQSECQLCQAKSTATSGGKKEGGK